MKPRLAETPTPVEKPVAERVSSLKILLGAAVALVMFGGAAMAAWSNVPSREEVGATIEKRVIPLDVKLTDHEQRIRNIEHLSDQMAADSAWLKSAVYSMAKAQHVAVEPPPVRPSTSEK